MKTLLKIIVSLSMLGYLFTHIHFHEVYQQLKNINVYYFLAANIALIFGSMVASFRWRMVMSLLGFKRKYAFFIKSYFKGGLFNQFLPTSIGGDAYRVFEVGQQADYDHKRSFSGIFIDRVYGSLGLTLINVVANFSGVNPLPQSIQWIITLIAGLSMLAWVTLVNFHRLPLLPHYRLFAWITALSKTASLSFSNLFDMFIKLLLSMLANLFTVISAYLIGLSLQLSYPFMDYLLIIPLVNLIILIPISMAGWGLREGSMVSLFALIGASKPAIMSLSLLQGVCLMITALPGLYYWLSHRSR